jgi:hypothetical protein
MLSMLVWTPGVFRQNLVIAAVCVGMVCAVPVVWVVVPQKDVIRPDLQQITGTRSGGQDQSSETIFTALSS